MNAPTRTQSDPAQRPSHRFLPAPEIRGLARRLPVTAQLLRVIGPVLHAVATTPG